jgi:2-keto-3-deoxy-galactonokinase
LNSVALLALDWGTSNLRACLLDAKGQAIEHRSAPGGRSAVDTALQPLNRSEVEPQPRDA